MSRIKRLDTAFAKPTQRRPRVKNDKHLEFIRSLPCLVCHEPNRTEAAHVRFAAPEFGKRETGKGEKPDDIWALPLCGHCHRTGKNAQHTMSEEKFWNRHYIYPLIVALALWAATGDYERGLMIVEANR